MTVMACLEWRGMLAATTTVLPSFILRHHPVTNFSQTIFNPAHSSGCRTAYDCDLSNVDHKVTFVSQINIFTHFFTGTGIFRVICQEYIIILPNCFLTYTLHYSELMLYYIITCTYCIVTLFIKRFLTSLIELRINFNIRLYKMC